jgi:hypothetical protein
LSVGDDGIPFLTTAPEVVLLEVAGYFVKAISGYGKLPLLIDRDVTTIGHTGSIDHAPGWRYRKVE